MPKRTSDGSALRFVIVTLDSHLSGAFDRARAGIEASLPVHLSMHAAASWSDPAAIARCVRDIGRADILVVTQLFLEEQVAAVRDAIEARRAACDAVVCAMSAPELMRLTRMGRFSMDEDATGSFSPLALLKRLRKRKGADSAGEAQMRQLRRLPRLLRFIPGTAQDVRAYFLTLQYWLAGSEENLGRMVRFLVGRYAHDGALREAARAGGDLTPIEYPETGVYHPSLPDRFAADAHALAKVRRRAKQDCGTVGLLVMRSYLLAGNTEPYDAVIAALEARGLRVVPAFAYGLDARPAVERFFQDAEGRPLVDAVVSLTGFSLVGGPAYHDADAAKDLLTRLDVPYLVVQSLEFQTADEWRADPRGLTPLQATLMVAMPELDGATGPLVFAGRGVDTDGERVRPIADRVERLADRIARLVELRRTPRAERRLAIVLFNYPPNAGQVGTAAYLDVFASLHNVLSGLRDAGWNVEVPDDAEALRHRITGGNAERFGTPANVHARVSADHHVRTETYLPEIEATWGPAPGRQWTDGRALQVLGERFGDVFVGVQPPFGYEGDPMRLLFERGHAPTHAFAAFYRWLREDFGAHACLHFGTHGALEFMPGKQTGLSGECWPDRLIGDLPNLYLYAANNPSEGTIAKRRGNATLVTHLTPPVGRAGLYRGLLELKASLDAYRKTDPSAEARRAALAETLQAQASAVDLAEPEPVWAGEDVDGHVARLVEQVLELEYTLIPHGLHVVGRPVSAEARVETLLAVAACTAPGVPSGAEALGLDPIAAETALRPAVERLVETSDPVRARSTLDGTGPEVERLLAHLATLDAGLRANPEVDALVRALDGAFVAPAPGGDVLRNPDVLPTGRNLYGFDPWRVPSPFAVAEGRRQADVLLARHREDGQPFPESVALVLWGTDTMKTDGVPVAQALALLGAEPRFDAYGRLAGARLVPLAELGRPRVDVVLSVSGVFRDLLPLQMKLLAEAAWLAASAEEPDEANPVRRHARAHADALGCDLETAALRVFGNAEGSYGANVNLLVQDGRWTEEAELAETFVRRKSFGYGRDGREIAATQVMERVLADADAAFQNLDSVELGVNDVDQYFDSLGGLARSIERARGEPVAVYIGDATRGDAKVRTLSEQIALETRARTLNPKWYESLLAHGHEGVRMLEQHVTNNAGWSATTGAVAPWVYARVAETFVLDEAMRERLAALNASAASRMAGRLLEVTERGYWAPDAATLESLRDAADSLEDRLEGIAPEVAA